MTPADREAALTVACGLTTLCGAAAGSECVDTASGGVRDEPHWNRVTRGRRARFDADQLFEVPPNAVVHQLTAPEAHAICVVLAAVEHIPVGAHVAERGVVYVWPVGRKLTVLEEVSALRAFASVTDARIRWCPGVD